MTKSVNPTGIITFWVGNENVVREKCGKLLNELGIRGIIPPARRSGSALNRAMTDAIPTLDRVWEGNALIRPLRKSKGYAVVEEVRESGRNQYAHITSVRLVEGENKGDIALEFEQGVKPEFEAHVKQQYELYKTVLSSQALSYVLGGIATGYCEGVSLKPGGGFYEIMPDKFPRWEEFAKRLDECLLPGTTGPRIYNIHHNLDLDAVEAIDKALRADIKSRATELRADVFSPDAGKRKVSNRLKEARELEERVRRYESLLGRSFKEISEDLGTIQVAMDGVEMLASADGTNK